MKYGQNMFLSGSLPLHFSPILTCRRHFFFSCLDMESDFIVSACPFFTIHINHFSLCTLITASINLEPLSCTKVNRNPFHRHIHPHSSLLHAHTPTQTEILWITCNLTSAIKLMAYKYFSNEPNRVTV